MDDRIVVVPAVQVVHGVLGAAFDIDWYNVLVVGRGDAELEVGRQDAGTARCWETSEFLVMIDTQLLSVELHTRLFWAKEEHCQREGEIQEVFRLGALSVRSRLGTAPLEGAAWVGHFRPLGHAVLAALAKEEAVDQVRVVDQSD